MARKATIQRAETWVYITDDGTVKEIAAGKTPTGGGSVFLLRPVPHDLWLELQMYGSKDNKQVDRLRSGRVPSELLALIVEGVIAGWKAVIDGDQNEIEFTGPETTALLDPETKMLIGNFVMTRTNEEQKKRGKRRTRSAATRN